MKTPRSSDLSILVVEDVDEMRQLLEHTLQGIEGVKVSGLAKNGFEARLELSRRRPDLVLLDEILPGESSQDLLALFQEAGVEVVLITSLENPSSQLPVGAKARIAKPGWKSLEDDRKRIKKTLFSKPK